MPETVILRFQVQLLQFQPNVPVVHFKAAEHFVHYFVDAVIRLVQTFYEEIPDFRHQIRETEEAVRLGMF